MNNEFKAKQYKDATVYTLESASGGSTGAGSVASVSMPMGSVRRRGDNLIAQEADKNTVPSTTPRNFVAKNAKMGGAGAHRDKKKEQKQGVEKHKKPYMEDHADAASGWGQGSYDTYSGGNHGRGVAENPEWYNDEANSMTTSQLKSLYKHAVKLRQAVKQMQAQGDTLEPWQQSKVTKAADYLDAVFNAVDDEHDMGEEQGVAEGLNEGVGGNYLYHATGAVKLILQSGAINAAEGPQLATQAQTKLPTVSITRDWNYATGGKGSAATDHLGHDGIIILDRNAVESNFKTLGTSQSQTVRGLANPVDTDWGDKIKDRKAGTGGLDTNNDGNIDYKEIGNVAKSKMGDFGKKMISAKLNAPKAGGEFEEAVVVPKGSLPLKGTMVGFWVNPRSQLTKDPEVMNDPRRLELAPGGTGRFVKAQQTQGVAEEWSKKYKSSINCSHPKGFSQKAHCAGKKKHNESMMTVEAVCPDCGMCQTHGNLSEIKKGAKDSNGVTKCWPGHHASGTKKGKNGGQVRNCVPNEDIAEDPYFAMLERSVSQAQHNLMVGVAHNPQFAQKVKVKQKVGQEFAQADIGHDISKLPIRVPKKK
jgi:hypothetical protein